MNEFIALSLKEMKEVTGAKTKERMIKVLTNGRIPYWLRADGWPTTTYKLINESQLMRCPALTIGEPARPTEGVAGFNLEAAEK